jgi:hypothetical protein
MRFDVAIVAGTLMNMAQSPMPALAAGLFHMRGGDRRLAGAIEHVASRKESTR